MIDWATVEIPLVHSPLNGGVVQSITSDGEIEWATPKRVSARGSYEKTISVKSTGGTGEGMATHLWISGNPSKFLQGHNVFGSDDLISLIYDTFIIIKKQFHLEPTVQEMALIKKGAYDLKTVDINYSYSLPTQSDVKAYIRALEFKAKTRHGRPSTKGGTLYFGQKSSRWAIKFYSKADEILKADRKLPIEIQSKGIEDWVQNKLRIELRLLSKELRKLDVVQAKDLTITMATKLFNQYVRKIDMTQQITLSDETIASLPNKLRSTYTLWKEGHDLIDMMSPATFRRHRSELKSYGINIDLHPQSTNQSNVVPLIRVLEAEPENIPDWAYKHNLVHLSARSIA